METEIRTTLMNNMVELLQESGVEIEYRRHLIISCNSVRIVKITLNEKHKTWNVFYDDLKSKKLPKKLASKICLTDRSCLREVKLLMT